MALTDKTFDSEPGLDLSVVWKISVLFLTKSSHSLDHPERHLHISKGAVRLAVDNHSLLGSGVGQLLPAVRTFVLVPFAIEKVW